MKAPAVWKTRTIIKRQECYQCGDEVDIVACFTHRRPQTTTTQFTVCLPCLKAAVVAVEGQA